MTEQEKQRRIEEVLDLVDNILINKENREVTKEALEKQIAKQPTNKQGNPLWGYCPSCKKPISKGGSPIGCKWCLQRILWGNEDENSL